MNIVEGELTSVGLCWRVERRDGAGVALTSHDAPLMSGGIFHDPAPGMTPAAITRSLGLQPHDGEVAGALSSAVFQTDDLALGRWDGGEVSLAVADWENPSAEPLPLLNGTLGAVSVADDGFTAELSGAAAQLSAPVCPATSAECRAQFGDKMCRVDLAGRTVVTHVTAVEGTAITVDADVDERFVLGRLRFMSGDNCGLPFIVIGAEGNSIQLREPPAGAIEVGCRVELREGCDKRFSTCVSRFANAANFRGEPHLPGNDLLTRYPGA